MSIKFNINVKKERFRNKKNAWITKIKISTGSFSDRALLESKFNGARVLDVNECRFQLDGIDIKRSEINDFINNYLDFCYEEHYHFAEIETYTIRARLEHVAAVEHELFFGYIN